MVDKAIVHSDYRQTYNYGGTIHLPVYPLHMQSYIYIWDDEQATVRALKRPIYFLPTCNVSLRQICLGSRALWAVSAAAQRTCLQWQNGYVFHGKWLPIDIHFHFNMGLYGDFLKWGYPESASQSLDQFSIETCLGNPRF
jgi:hypothetical protein